jgi:hypothetical protein
MGHVTRSSQSVLLSLSPPSISYRLSKEEVTLNQSPDADRELSDRQGHSPLTRYFTESTTTYLQRARDITSTVIDPSPRDTLYYKDRHRHFTCLFSTSPSSVYIYCVLDPVSNTQYRTVTQTHHLPSPISRRHRVGTSRRRPAPYNSASLAYYPDQSSRLFSLRKSKYQLNHL